MADMLNATTTYHLPPLPDYTLQPLPPLIPGIPDLYLALGLPLIAYWAVSLLFHCIDEWDFFPQYRLHTPAEVLKRNHATRWDVLRDVLIQQAIQTAMGLSMALIDAPQMCGKADYDVAVWAQRIRLAQRAIPITLSLMGIDVTALASSLITARPLLARAISGGTYPTLTQQFIVQGQPTIAPAFASWELFTAKALYHLAIPGMQFLLAICILDTWQYFLHRLMHTSRYLYNAFHSRHHRLYVPYAYGALYNHPFEGFLLDTLGTCIAYLVSGMTVRQSMWFFTMTTIKTVDDHCGYVFPWDPLQKLTSNNAGYHDVHHQSWGIKTNFSQPYFTFWDELLGTKWTGGDVSARYEKARLAAQKKVDADAKPITASRVEESARSPDALYAGETEAASSTARSAQTVGEPRIPAGKASQQAVGSRQQILDDRQGGGVSVLAEEAAEEAKAQMSVRRSPRKRTTSSGLKGLADRVGESLQGKSSGVLGLDCTNARR
ncbi:hypothetical protein BAUCODRAFT_38034 [Baudoinia panamericana UAMH 10762]|uniref:Fatty acid hydroxylase domain-containing protein n=1 Tax=Baudoinia panamericana (strain UAMH 10762) TaxID=717646 RepID=M2LDH6_BAUPA|nr:uncharacterized protein BAUCODRAFT_38034 [Baudoinia panamericana UAMH 10762]EMC92017.1 hypothetical protein BAUCODRAFT_38034 [Baudoinia panamericana UAMH 10762]